MQNIHIINKYENLNNLKYDICKDILYLNNLVLDYLYLYLKFFQYISTKNPK